MKTRNYVLLTVAMLVAVLAGCQRKSAEPQVNAEEAAVEKTFYGSTTNREKTTLASDFNTLWTEGDKIKVFAAGGAGTDFTLTTGAGTSYGEFSGSTAATEPYVAVYPSTFATSVSGTVATVELPATQIINAAGTFATNTVPLVAYSTSDFLYFKNIGSLLCLSLKAKRGSSVITKIELQGNNSETIAGIFTVKTDDSQPKAVYSTGGKTKITAYCYDIITIDSTTPTNFYIFVPAGVFSKGFTATLYRSADDLTAEITTSGNLTTEVSKGQIFAADVEFCKCGKQKTVKYSVSGGTGYAYPVVPIGEQCWMAENVKETLYDTQSEAYKAGIKTISTSSSATYDPYYIVIPDNKKPEYMSDGQFSKLGLLYNWAATMGYKDAEEAKGQTGDYSGVRQGICPNGWHLPSESELKTLESVLGGQEVAAGKMRTSTGWESGIGEGDDGFAALPAGGVFRDHLEYVGKMATCMSSSANASESAVARAVQAGSSYLYYLSPSKGYAQSVRCLKN